MSGKPQALWDEIRALYESGRSAYSIARKMTEAGNKISRQGIIKKAKLESWVAGPSIAERRRKASLVTPLTPKEERAVLSALRNGLPREMAAGMAMTNVQSITAWEYAKPNFCLNVRKAEAEFFAARVADLVKASERGDTEAALFLANLSSLTHEDRKEIAASILKSAA